ncbi:D-alanyl-D-alanine carboxypeptidase [Methylocapsa sp. S129]|uniref:D-alanyl-D-alanine carboxypeptidase n=1 Tax=Methylocapsa sp. S129 TaxID=1641869 RepID=UPI00131B5696|nr:D-alanyl-D-alanine carboxypeptidase [Methylocapsa sp. S129]
MALRFGKIGSRRATPLAAIGAALAALALFATPAEARHWRHYHYYARQHYRSYARQPAAPSPAFAALVVDANSGRTLYAASENELRHPASLTKVMTLYLLFEQLEKGRLSLDSPITMSAHAASQAPSKLGLDPGETISVDNAIKAVVTRSANDVAVAIGENIAGDEDSFAEMMTRKAHALGMSRTTYVNASGLPDDRQITTAHDLAVLGRAVQERFPRYFRYFSTHSFDYAGETIGNHNHLLGRVDGVDGIKTGYTRASGFNLLTSVHRDGRALVAVVMGGPTASARDRLMEQLIAQHIASATTAHTATMIADASTPEPAPASSDRRGSAAPLQLAAMPPAPPVRIAMATADAPLPPTRSIALSNDDREDAEGDGDNVERDPPTPTLEAVHRQVRREIHDAPAAALAAPAPPPVPVRVADNNPAALGWVKGPDGVAPPEPKASQPEKAMAAAAALPALLPPSPPVRAADNSPAALGWVKGPNGVAPSAAPKAGPAAKTVAAAPARVAEPKAAPAKAIAAAQPKEETHVARSEDVRSSGRDGWMIQIGASENADKANDLLNRAKAQNRSTLASAKPFTEKVANGDSTFYRARFAGLDSSSAEAACKTLKRTGFSCFATHD